MKISVYTKFGPINSKDIFDAFVASLKNVLEGLLIYQLSRECAGSWTRDYLEEYSQNNPPGSFCVLVEDNYDLFLSNVKAAYLVKDCIA